MKKNVILILNATIIIGVIITIILLFIKFENLSNDISEESKNNNNAINQDNEAIMQDDASYNDLKEQVQQLRIDYDELRLDYEEIKSSLSNIPVDEDLVVKERVEEWLALFRNKSPEDIDMEIVSEIMGVNSTHYFEWYPDFSSEEGRRKLDYMIDIVFYEGEAVSVKGHNYNNHEYLVEDTEGNEFFVYYNENRINSIWTYAYYCDNSFDSFVEALKKEDIDLLYSLLFYESYEPYEESVNKIYDEYINVFDLSTIGYQFIGIDLNGFKYNLYDKSGNQVEVYVNHSDSITGIRKANDI